MSSGLWWLLILAGILCVIVVMAVIERTKQNEARKRSKADPLMEASFENINDEKIKQALAQGFSAGVDWCCSEQFDADVAKAALAIGLAPEEAATGAVRKTG